MRLFNSLKNLKKTDAKFSKKSFELNNHAAIGIDIDQYSIKMVQLSGRSLNQIQLEKYVIAKLPKNIVQGNKVQNHDQLVTYLQQAYVKLNYHRHTAKFGNCRAAGIYHKRYRFRFRRICRICHFRNKFIRRSQLRLSGSDTAFCRPNRFSRRSKKG